MHWHDVQVCVRVISEENKLNEEDEVEAAAVIQQNFGDNYISRQRKPFAIW